VCVCVCESTDFVQTLRDKLPNETRVVEPVKTPRKVDIERDTPKTRKKLLDGQKDSKDPHMLLLQVSVCSYGECTSSAVAHTHSRVCAHALCTQKREDYCRKSLRGQ
jgi:hypothetical protein